MMRVTCLAAAVALSMAGQTPAIQNGRIDSRTGGDLRAVVGSVEPKDEPVWITWSVPMIPGERQLCSVWSSQTYAVRGMYLEGWTGAMPPPMSAPPGPTRLEAGTRLVVFARVLNGTVERVRISSDDCPVDAGGLRVVRIDSVTAQASIAYLESLLVASASSTESRPIASAVSAIALHDSAAADEVLERLAATAGERDAGRQAASWLARARGRRGFDALSRLVASTAVPATRRALVAALAQSPLPETFDTLSTLARTHSDERVRIEAVRAISRSTDPRAKEFLTGVLRQ